MDESPEVVQVTPPETFVERSSRPRLMTPDEMQRCAPRGFEATETEQFIRERVIGVRMPNGLNVTFIDFDHDEEGVDPITRAYMEAVTTKANGIEYFYPEVKGNSQKLGFGNQFKEMDEAEATHDDGNPTDASRIDYARKLAQVCAQIEKPVLVADIANKPTFFLAYALLKTYPLLSSSFAQLCGIVAAQQGHLGVDAQQYLLALNAITAVVNLGYIDWVSKQFRRRVGMFDEDTIAAYEPYLLDFDLARRMYVAYGIKQVADEYKPEEGEEDANVVFLYPKAHGRRIAQNLIYPSRMDKAKDIMYRLFGHTLDFAVRTWRYQKVPKTTRKEWQLTKREPIVI